MNHLMRMLLLLAAISGCSSVIANNISYSDETILFNFQDNAPADTMFYLDGLVDSKTATVAEALSVYSPQMELLVVQLDSLDANQYQAEIDFMGALLAHGLEAQKNGLQGVRNAYGLHKSMASATYLDGLIPVFQVAIDDPQPLKSLFIQAAKDSGVAHKVLTLGHHTIDYWVLQTKQDLGVDLWLTLAATDSVASIAIMPAHLSQARRLDVLGLLPEAYSLADAQGMKEVRKTEGFLNYTAGFFNILEITRLATDPKNSKAGEDLMTLAGQEILPELSVACRRDWLGLAENVPKLVFGTDVMNLQGNTIEFNGHMLLQIKDANIAQTLQQLNGHLPNYALSVKDTLLSVALGLDMSALMPAISNLRRQLLASSFDCQELVDLQEEAMSIDLSALMVASAAGQGISGFGAAIYDIDFSAIAKGNFATDAIISITTAYPELLSSLVSFVPQLEGISIPSDGSSVDLNLNSFPPGLKPKMAIKGNHFVIYDGPISAAVAEQMAFETPNKRGLYASSVNYEKLGSMVYESLDLFTSSNNFNANECADLHVAMSTFSNTKAAITMEKVAVKEGVRFDLKSLITAPSRNTYTDIRPASYQLLRLSDGCEWLFAGVQSLHSDGTGDYEVADDAQECAVVKTQYNWQQSGARIMFNETASFGRDACSENMTESVLLENECIVLDASKSGFDCLFSPASDTKEIYRYILRP